MQLTHDGAPNEVLSEGGVEYRRGDTFEVDDSRGAFLLEAQPVKLIAAGEEADPPARGGWFAAAEANLKTPDVASLEQTVGVADSNAPEVTDGADNTTREASTGEAQSTEGDKAA